MDIFDKKSKGAVFVMAFIMSCFTMNSDKLHGYMKSQGTPFIMFRLVVIAVFMFVITIANSDNIKFISKFEPICVNVITGIMIFDYFVTQISGSQFLFRVWWIASIFTAQIAVFLALTISNTSKDEYRTFFKQFWIGFSPIYIFILVLCFARTPNSGVSINMVLGGGTFEMLKSFLRDINVSFEAPLIFFGNLLIFSPIAFIAKSLFNKAKGWQIITLGIIIPFLIEGYQYFFRCGDVDIDDIILNITGFIIGYIIMQIIAKRKSIGQNA